MKKDAPDAGYALVIVMGFIAVLCTFLAVAIAMTTSSMRVAAAQTDMEMALYVAQAGAERAAAYVGGGGNGPWSSSGQVGDGTYVVAVVPAATPNDAPRTVGGTVSINPSASPDFAFALHLPDGTTIDRYDLGEDFPGYTGPAVYIHLRPKGGGKQNALTLDGVPYELDNNRAYDIFAGAMDVQLYNDHVDGNGKAKGKWMIAIATSCASFITAN